MTIEPFKIQGMTYHLDSWEEHTSMGSEHLGAPPLLDSSSRETKA